MKRVIRLRPRGNDLLEELAHRLAELLEESPNPRDEMNSVEIRLEEAGLWFGGFRPDIDPLSFAWNILVENPLMQEHAPEITIEMTPALFETVGDLISHVLPGRGGLD